MKNRRNYYRLLHVQPDAPAEVIKASYRTLMGKLNYHPDLGGTHQMAALVNAAFETLGDPDKRAEYDRLLFAEYSKKSIADGRLMSQSNTSGDIRSNRGPHQLKQSGISREKEQRAADRVEQKGAIFYSVQRSDRLIGGEMVDFSSRGMRFSSIKKIDASTRIEIQTPLLFGTATVKHCDEIRRNSDCFYLIGVRFNSVEFNRPRGTFLDLKA